ncbi:MAG: hypothetical protein JW963_18300, partial [Anaerolineales bacterium]|nr:hypothetical protein [Anaerolineales bacterium]
MAEKPCSGIFIIDESRKNGILIFLVGHFNVTSVMVTDWGAPDFGEVDADVPSLANPTLSSAPQLY